MSSKIVYRGLIPKYNRLFEVIKKVDHVAYRLSDRLKIHPTFHMSFLTPYNQDEMDGGRRQAKHAPPVIRKQFGKGMLIVLDHRMMGQSKKNRRTNYLIHYKGENALNATREHDVTLCDLKTILLSI